MTKSRLIAMLMALALALATTPAVLADSHESSDTYDPSTVEEWNEDEALIFYQALENKLLAMGVAGEDMDEAVAYLQETYANLSEEDIEDLAEASAAMGMMEELSTEEEGEEVDLGDDEFMQSEEDEPEMGDDDEDDDE